MFMIELILDTHRYQDILWNFVNAPFFFGGRGKDPESSAIDKGYEGSEDEEEGVN